MKTLQKDLTTGNPGKIIFNFTLPIFIGNVFQQFYSMAEESSWEPKHLRLLEVRERSCF